MSYSVTPWIVALQAPLSSTISWSLLKFISIELVILSNHVILCYPHFSSCPQSFPASGSFPISQLFTSGGQSMGASASATVLPMNMQGWFPLGLTGLISLQRTLCKSLLQHHSSKASILWCSAFFMVQLSHPYMTTGKTIALTIWTLVSKLISLLFNTLSRFVIAFFQGASVFLISWLQLPSAVIFGAQENKMSLLLLFPLLFAMKWWDQVPWSIPGWVHLNRTFWLMGNLFFFFPPNPWFGQNTWGWRAVGWLSKTLLRVPLL